MANNRPTQVTIGKKVRFCFLKVVDGEKVTDPKTGKERTRYSACLLVPKTAAKSIAAINAAIEAAKVEGESKLKNPKTGKIANNIKLPLRDGDVDKEGDEVFAGHYFLNANTYIKPVLLDEDGDEMLDVSDMYSGCYGSASINFFAYDSEGSKGIAVSINALKKNADGERLAGQFDAESAFNSEDDLD